MRARKVMKRRRVVHTSATAGVVVGTMAAALAAVSYHYAKKDAEQAAANQDFYDGAYEQGVADAQA